jgi:hypothetical protein
MLFQRSINSNIFQPSSITRDLKMLVMVADSISGETPSSDLISPLSGPTVSSGPFARGSNRFGYGVDFSGATNGAFRFPHSNIDVSQVMTVMAVFTTGAQAFETPLHMNLSAAGFRLICNFESGADVALVTSNSGSGNWSDGLKASVANGTDVIVIGSMSSGTTTKTMIDLFINGIETITTTAANAGDGSSRSEVSMGNRTDLSVATDFSGVFNMFAIWNRVLSVPEKLQLTADPWMMVREPYPISAIAAAASGAAAPSAPTGRRRIIVTTS